MGSAFFHAKMCPMDDLERAFERMNEAVEKATSAHYKFIAAADKIMDRIRPPVLAISDEDRDFMSTLNISSS